ncbi:MAG: hypothetical protein GY859_06740, partial [Desulfobacterales bacterium]|nr:hypothetical protein [Desulfobacterales bacterium]
LAHALRRRFHPHLPHQRIERLYALPGTSENRSGLRFSTHVCKALRQGFINQREDADQEDVLKFILEEVKKAEPGDHGGPAHLAWEMRIERIRLELGTKDHYARFASLAGSPLGGSVAAELEDFGFRDDPDKVPLRIARPKHKHELQRLDRVSKNFGITEREKYSVGVGFKWILTCLTLIFIGFSGGSVN